MRSLTIVLCILAGAFSLRPTAIDACGGTLTRVGQGPRFMRDAAKKNPARVAVYAPNSLLAAFAPQLESYLKQEGHKAQTITTEAALNEALRNGQFDAIVTDFHDAGSIRPATSNAVVVPIAYKLSKAEKAQAKAFKYRIENPDNGNEYMNVLYNIMKSKGSKLA